MLACGGCWVAIMPFHAYMTHINNQYDYANRVKECTAEACKTYAKSGASATSIEDACWLPDLFQIQHVGVVGHGL